MANWEYRIEVISGDGTSVISALNTLGNDGWEVSEVISPGNISYDVDGQGNSIIDDVRNFTILLKKEIIL